MTNDAAVIVGMGELGSEFARGFLKAGRPVVPVLRGMNLHDVAERVSAPAVCLVAVGETDLAAVLQALPDRWRDRVALLQNELVPATYESVGIDATVCGRVVRKEARPSGPSHPAERAERSGRADSRRGSVEAVAGQRASGAG